MFKKIKKYKDKIVYSITGRIPRSYSSPINKYDIPIHNQGKENSCTAHAFAYLMELQLSEKFKERTLVDVDDLWEKQKKFGTATEKGDCSEGPFLIAQKYGVNFKTDSGIEGTYFLGSRIELKKFPSS